MNIAAKWSKELYEEARRDIANVAVPKKTIKTLFAEQTPTPGTKTSRTQLAVPSIIKKAVQPLGGAELLTQYGTSGGILASRENKVKMITEVLPAEVVTTETTAPKYQPTITFKSIMTPIGSIKIPSINWGAGTTAIEDKTGTRYITFEPSDYKTTKTTQTLPEAATEYIEEQKATVPGAKEWWEQSTIGNTPIDIPQIPDVLGGLGDIGKYALIAGGLILAAVLLKGK